jgi:ATP-dependent Clp protease, protease subunit
VTDIRMAKEGSTATIYVYDEIGSGSFFFEMFGAKDMQRALGEAGNATDLVVRINSMGGSAHEAIAMHNLLKDHPAKVTTIVDGMAASAASVVFMAGDSSEMRTGSQLMIHNPSRSTWGDIKDHERSISSLKSTTEAAIDIYEKKSGKSRESIGKMMDEETWLTSSEAKEEGFADVIVEAEAVETKATPEMAARTRRQFKRMPDNVLVMAAEPSPKPTPKPKEPSMSGDTVSADDVKSLLADFKTDLKNELKELGNSSDDPPEMTEAEAERHRVSEIHSVCQMAGIDAAQIKKYVDEETSLETVQMAVIEKLKASNKPASEGGGDGIDADPHAAYRKEYKDAMNSGVAMSCSENEYVNVRLQEDGKPVVDFEKKGA